MKSITEHILVYNIINLRLNRDVFVEGIGAYEVVLLCNFMLKVY